MNIFAMVRLLFSGSKSSVPPDLTLMTCPTCGNRQQEDPAEKKFVCKSCGYTNPLLYPSPSRHRVNWFQLRPALDLSFLFLGILSATIGLKSFLLPNQLIDGGVTGISMLAARITGIDLSWLIALINLPFMYAAWTQVGRGFAIRCALSIIGLSFMLGLISLPVLTRDHLLDAVFGGFFLGAGIGLSIRGGGVLDGTEVMALMISKRFPATIGDVILVFNILIFSAGSLVLPIESVMYSILTYVSASKTVDFLMHGIEPFNGILIVSRFHQDIRQAIVNDLGRGVTILQGKGGYSAREQEVLFCIITRLEIPKIRSIVHEIDPTAFLIIAPVTEVSGGMIRKVLDTTPPVHT
ncbi:MAG TPA: YitT family protein [Candidatus Ozemobacteraceae bacterium]|nr:YitT family protein [Candidatus Ozemobacteraceae bacterium]